MNKTGFTIDNEYEWRKGVLIKKIFGTLSWIYKYVGDNSQFLEQTTDENGLIKKFTYDALMRLYQVKDRVKPGDDNDVQATTTYTYQYKNASNPYNFVGTSTSFKDITAPLSTKQYMDGLGRPIEVVKEFYTPKSTAHPNDD
jgi:hypothetical protein